MHSLSIIFFLLLTGMVGLAFLTLFFVYREFLVRLSARQGEELSQHYKSESLQRLTQQVASRLSHEKTTLMNSRRN